jgi:hypothetical protein
MEPEITLTYYDEAGRLQRARVESKRFSIGRIPDNDLMIEHSSLSRRHALIESFDNVVQISDCGSRNGTFLNGAQVTLPVELQDGDVINLADVCELTVEFSHARSAQPPDAVSQSAASPLSQEDLLRRIEAGLSAQQTQTVSHSPRNAPEPKVPFASLSTPEGLNVYIIAPVIAVVVLALVVLAAVALKGRGAKRMERQPNTTRERIETGDNNISNVPTLPTPDVSSTIDAPADQMSEELEEVEKNALAVMRAISKSDSSPVLTGQSVKEIDERIKRYRGSSTLRDNLRVMKQRGAEQLGAAARSKDIKLPLVIFAALAKMDKEGLRGDPVAVAQGMLPLLADNVILLGNELANDNLLSLVATDPSTGSARALRDSIAGLANQRPNASPAVIRNVWFLHENRKITDQAYDLLLRFLAIGAIAQNPRHYGIEAEPLAF